MDAMVARLIKAAAILLIGLALVLGIQALFDAASQGEGSSSNTEGSAGVVILGEGDDRFSEALSFVCELGFYGSMEVVEEPSISDMLPSGFCDEVVDLHGFDQVFASTARSVVGFVVSGNPDAAYREYAEKLEGNGWTSVPSGQENQCSLVKENGMYRWAYLAVSGTDDSSVCVIALEGDQS